MDFLDSISKIDLHACNQKAHRVRSWYLYEQYKSLEKNQLDAAQKLKNRSSQEKILHKELSERRLRRRLYDKFDLSPSSARPARSIRSENAKTTPSVTSHDFYETYSELDNFNLTENIDINSTDDQEENVLSDDCNSGTSKTYSVPDYNTRNSIEIRDDISYAESVNSVVENVKIEGNIADEVKEELEIAKKNIADNIKLQLETVKENIQSLEKYTLLYDETSEDSMNLMEDQKLKVEIHKQDEQQENDNNLYTMWSKLVSFAYQVVQLNHGNCYYDFSSQFLTAVLACDVIRRSVNKMCHILQPYVSPIKFATDDADPLSPFTLCHVNAKRKTSSSLIKPMENKINYCRHIKPINRMRHIERRYRSENFWEYRSKYLTNEDETDKRRRSSEPWRSVAKFSSKSTQKNTSEPTSSCCTWIEANKPRNSCRYPCHAADIKRRMLNYERQTDYLFDESKRF